MGLWMLAFNVTFFEDMRLCMPRCKRNAVAVLKNKCSGLCSPAKIMRFMHQMHTCHGAPEHFLNGSLPYESSYPGHNFDRMHAL
jgi:hypothetical protein